jgi:hypothetical protein
MLFGEITDGASIQLCLNLSYNNMGHHLIVTQQISNYKLIVFKWVYFILPITHVIAYIYLQFLHKI